MATLLLFHHESQTIDSDQPIEATTDHQGLVLTRSIARWLYDLRDDDRDELVEGVEFRSRHGDDMRVWAVFERAEDEGAPHSRLLEPAGIPARVTDETPELVEAFDHHGLRWGE